MNKIKTKSEHIPRPRAFLYIAKIESPRRSAHNPKMNSAVPKMNKKSGQDQKNPKKPTKMFKNGKIAERAFFGQ